MDIKGNITEINNQMRYERDLLDGNLNRIMVCNNDDELDDMFLFAIRRINHIYEIKRSVLLYERIKNKKGVIL